MIKIEDGKIVDIENEKLENEKHFRNFKIQNFTDALASKDAYPGGGAVAGLVASQGFALISMVCNLTIGKKKFEEFEEELTKIKENATKNYDRMLDLIQLDGINFEPLAKAYSLPKDTAEEKEYRDSVMNNAIIKACYVPIETAKASYEALDTLTRLKDISSLLVLSDVGVALECFMSAIRSSMLNIFINLKTLKDSDDKKAIQDFVDSVKYDYMTKYYDVNNFVIGKIS